jgi:hypothetical protein
VDEVEQFKLDVKWTAAESLVKLALSQQQLASKAAAAATGKRAGTAAAAITQQLHRWQQQPQHQEQQLLTGESSHVVDIVSLRRAVLVLLVRLRSQRYLIDYDASLLGSYQQQEQGQGRDQEQEEQQGRLEGSANPPHCNLCLCSQRQDKEQDLEVQQQQQGVCLLPTGRMRPTSAALAPQQPDCLTEHQWQQLLHHAAVMSGAQARPAAWEQQQQRQRQEQDQEPNLHEGSKEEAAEHEKQLSTSESAAAGAVQPIVSA